MTISLPYQGGGKHQTHNFRKSPFRILRRQTSNKCRQKRKRTINSKRILKSNHLEPWQQNGTYFFCVHGPGHLHLRRVVGSPGWPLDWTRTRPQNRSLAQLGEDPLLSTLSHSQKGKHSRHMKIMRGNLEVTRGTEKRSSLEEEFHGSTPPTASSGARIGRKDHRPGHPHQLPHFFPLHLRALMETTTLENNFTRWKPNPHYFKIGSTQHNVFHQFYCIFLPHWNFSECGVHLALTVLLITISQGAVMMFLCENLPLTP